MTTPQRHRRWLLLLALLLVLGVWLKNAWVCDDAYINFRSLDQLRAGHGPVWNPHERVQVYTSVLWYWLQAPLRLVSADCWLNVLLLSLACLAGCVAALRRLLPDDRAHLLLAALLVGARGCFDFTAGGLETPLVYLVCLLLLRHTLLVNDLPAAAPDAARHVRRLVWLTGAALLVRHDLAVLWCAPVAHACWRHRRLWPWRRWLVTLAAGSVPLMAWSAFAVFYYGSPWPNPALAKLDVGLPTSELIRQGSVYLFAHAADPVLAVVLLAGTAAALARPATRWVGVGIVLCLVYLVRIGGDFMLGRMLGAPCLVAAVVLVRELTGYGKTVVWCSVGLAAAAAVLLPRTPLNTTLSLHDETVAHRLADERAYYCQATSLWTRLHTASDDFPAHEWTEAGRRASRRDGRLVGAQNLGFFGHAAGTEKIVVDLYAITDPFLSRLPTTHVPPDWRPGHIKRSPPPGYSQSLQTGANRLRGAGPRALYDDVRLATSAPLLAPGRAAAIWRLNTGVRGR